jgi:cobalt-zinc-cadmium efflux system membrane fusion protein
MRIEEVELQDPRSNGESVGRARRTRLLIGGLALLVGLGLAIAPLRARTLAGASPSDAGSIPADEIWLTDAQIAERGVAFAPVEEQTRADDLTTSGRVTFDDARLAEIYAPVSGRVTRIDAAVGETVRAGDTLAILESPELGAATAELAAADSAVRASQRELSRLRALVALGGAAARELERAEATHGKAVAERARAVSRASLLGGAGVRGVTQALTLRTPFAGTVLARSVFPGAEVLGRYAGGASPPLFVVADPDRVWVLADIHESEIGRVSVGQRMSITVPAEQTRRFECTIDWISSVLSPSTRTATARCHLDNVDRALLPETFVNVRIHTQPRVGLALPRAALHRRGDVTLVYVDVGRSPDGRTCLRRVPLLIPLPDDAEWVGVDETDAAASLAGAARVVVAGGDRLEERP